eukprot:g6847.t1
MTTAAAGSNGTAADRIVAREDQNPSILSSPQSPTNGNVSLVNLVPALMRAKRRWRALVDGDTGSTYYIDQATGVSQWERPPPEEITQSADDVVVDDPILTPSTEHRKEENHSLVTVVPALMRAKRRWLALVDDSTGSTYYVDEATGTTQWEKPPEVDQGGSEEDEKKAASYPQEVASGAVMGGLDESENQARAAPEIDTTTERSGDALVRSSVSEDEKKATTSGGAGEVPLDKDIQGGVDGDPFLQRADSSSTLSTYGGELESLAKYVTGHSTTLDRGTIVDVDLSKNEGGAGGKREEGGERISDTGEETVQSTDPSNENNGSAAESEIVADAGKSSTHSESSTPNSVDVRGAPSISEDSGSPSAEDSSRREPQPGVQPGESATDGTSSSSIQSIGQQHTLDVLMENTSRLEKPSQIDADYSSGCDGGAEPAVEVHDRPATSDDKSPSAPAEPKGGEVRARTASAVEGFGVEGIEERAPGQYGKDSSSVPSPTNGLDEADGNSIEEAWSNTSGAGKTLSTEVTEASTALLAKGHAPVPSALISGNNNESNAVQLVERSGDDPPQQHTVITAASAAVAKSPLPFDTAAVTIVALERLKAGMRLRQQREASVKLQANARGWVARRVCARLAERRETRRREERDAKQRAATAIQSMVRGRAGRNKAQRARHTRTEQGIQQAQLETTGSAALDREESTSQRGDESVDRLLHVGPAVCHLSSEGTDQSDEIRAPGSGVPPETSVPLANGSTVALEKEEYVTQPRKEEDFRGDGSHHDSVDPSAMEWSEVAAISREAKPSDPGQHQRHGGHEQDVFSPQLGEYVGTEGRFEPGPLGTIDEEGPQRNEHLWGGGGTEEPEPEHSVQTYSEYGTGPLGAQRTDAGVSFGSPELARKADTVQKSSPSSSETLDNDCDEITAQTNSPRSSETSGDDFDEEPSSDDREYDTDSIERRYDGSSRTSLSSKTATTTARNSSSTGAENTASGSHGDSRSLSDDGDLHPARDQSSTVWTEEEWVAQHHQQPADNDNAGQASEEFGGSESSAESQKAGAGVYLDATAPMDRLEDLRSLVAAQAQATARATMAAVGTEVFRREASRIRDLADRQAQVTDSFRDAVRHSIAVDAGDGEHSSCSVTSGSPSGLEAVPVTSPPERAGPEGGVAGGQPTEKQVVDQGDQSGRTPDGDDQAHTRRPSSWNDIGDGSANPPGDLRRTAVDLGAADDLPETNVSTDRAACVLGSDVSRLAARLGAAACELLRVSSSEAARKEAVVLDPRKDPRKDPEVHGALAALGQAVGLQAKAVGLMEEVVVRTVHSRLDARVAARAARKERAGRLAASLAEDVKLVAARHQNAARRMEAAPDPATARHVADDIRRLTLVQEKLAYKVQRYILSTSAALFNDDDNRQEKGAGDLVVGALEAPVAAEGKSHEAMMDEDITPEIAEADITAPAETETPQERLGKLATAAVKELRKGVDVGSVAAARAQAIRRGSQAGRLADELRLIASGQVAASSALAAAGEQLAADAMAEKPGPRDYTLPPRTRTRARRRAGVRKPASKSRGDSQILEDVVAGQRAIKEPGQGCGIITRNAGEPGSKQEATSDQGDDAVGGTASRDAEHFVGEGAGLPFATTNTAATAIETAAGLEEVAAAARIQSFLRRRRRQTRPDETGPLPVRSASSSVVEPSSDDQRSTDSTAEWFGAALRRLRGEVDSFLLGDEPQKDPGGAGRSEATPSQDAGDQTQEPELESRSVASRLSNADDGGRTDDDTADTRSSSESSGYDNDDDWPTFAPVPLRARAPSLYTLPAPGSSATSRRRTRDVDGDDRGAACSSRSTTAAEGQGGVFTKLGLEVVARLSSARSVFGLRAADVLAAFSPPPPPPCSSCPLSAFAAKPRDTTLSERPFTVPAPTIGIGDRLEHRGYGRLSSPDALRLRLRREAEDASRAGFGRPWLLSSRRQREPTRHRQQQEQLAAIVRARNRARGLRGGVEDGRETRRRLDFFGSWTPLGRRLAKRYNAGLAARRRRVLGETDQFRARHVGRQLRSGAVTSALEGVERALDLRLSVRREKRVPPSHVTELLDVFDRYVLSDSQELLGDLLQKHKVVRDQCSWGDDTNPFCCGRCSESSPVPGPPEEAESVVVLPLVDSQGEINSSSRVLLHILSSFAVVANNSSNISNRRAGTSLPCSASISFSPLPLPSGLNAQLLLVAGRLAVAIGRYPEAVRHVKAAVRAATHSDNVASRESPSILVSCSRVLEYVLDDRSAEIVLLGCILQYPDYQPALSSYGKLAARQMHLSVCMLEQLGPIKDERPPSRAVSRIDSLLRSALSCHFDGQPEPFLATPQAPRQQTTPKPLSPSTPTPHDVRRQRATRLQVNSAETNYPNNNLQTDGDVPSSPPRGSTISPAATKPGNRGRGAWLLWAFYAKFAERCLRDPRLAMYALEAAAAAAAAATSSPWVGRGRDRRKRGAGCGGGHGEGEVEGTPSNRGREAPSLALVARAQFCRRWPELFDDLAGGSTAGFSNGGAPSPPGELLMLTHALERYPNDPAALAALGYVLLSNSGGSRDDNHGFGGLREVENLDRAIAAFRRARGECHADCPPFLPAARGLAVATRRRRLMIGGAKRDELWPLGAAGDANVNINSGGSPQSGGGGGGSGRAISRAEDLLQKAIECSGRTVPSEILRTLAQIRAHRGRRSSAISLFRRAVNAAAAATDTSADDPLSLCGLAQILLAPYHRRRSCPPRARRLPCAGQGEDDGQTSNGCSGTATAAARPETDAAQPTTLTASAKAAQPTGGAPASAMEEEVPLIFPNDEEKSEAARLFARAFSSAGGVVPPEDVYFGSQADDVAAVRTCGDDGAVDRGMAREERDLVTLAEVHLAVSGFTLREGWRGRGSGNAAKEWHLQEAARVAPPDAKAGIIARYILGRQTLAAGDDKQAEKLFLEALDAEPTTFGGCAAMLSALRQVAVDVFQAKVKLRRLNRRLVKRHKGRRRGVGGAAQKARP